ncbi:MAG: FHA domain-containing protein [Deltaproteobacteria bacterium]|nr:MAG: FHA domain-containing protein [Deltaproteobacteria bacterium]
MAGARIPLTFRIFKGDELIREETLTQPVIKVGKLSSSHLRLDDESVSRMHAVIEVQGPGDISIIDLGSTKGTIVNGQKVNKAKLQDGDLIQLGDLRIEFSVGEPVEDMDDAPTKVQESPIATQSGPQEVIASVPHPSVGGPGAPAARAPAAAPAAVAPPAAAAHVPPPAGIAPPPGLGGAAPAPTYGAPAPASGPPVYGGAAPAAPLTDLVDDVAGAPAVEVAAMLDDSVVDVRHLTNPRGGKVSTRTIALFVGAAICLLIGFYGFFTGVANAKFNKEALHEWTEVERLPLHDFRPRPLSIAYDFITFGGFGGALVLATIGLLRLRREKESPYFRIGTTENVEFPFADAPAPEFALVAPHGDEFVVNFAQNMTGEFTDESGATTPLSELVAQNRARPSTTAPGAYEMSLPPRSRLRILAGRNTFLVSAVPRPRALPMPLLATIDRTILSYVGGAAAVMLGFLALAFSAPPSAETMFFDPLGGDMRMARVQTAPVEDPKQEEQLAEDDKGDDKSGGTGTKMALDEGKMGKKDSTRQSGQYAMKRNYDGDPQLARQQAMEAARTSGILGAFNAQPGGAFASITGTGDFSSGLDDRDVYGGLIGNEVGEMQGGWGYGLKGTGPGGGGTGWGTIGTGRYGTIGHGSGTGSGYGIGSAGGGMRGRKARPPQVSIGHATATGDLDKSIIRRYIRKKLPQIKYCYEKQLLVNQKLSGTVVTNFTISGNGAVLSVTAGGIGDKTVENCVAAAIKTIQFPKPKGGGLVNVRYPFTFRPAGE